MVTLKGPPRPVQSTPACAATSAARAVGCGRGLDANEYLDWRACRHRAHGPLCSSCRPQLAVFDPTTFDLLLANAPA
jgi:hypothetical protein